MIKNKVILIFLFLIFAFAYFLRVMFLSDLALTFGYDQARDALVAKQILSGDLKILGPPASTPGLYHGVFWFYFLAPAYWASQGSPIVAAFWSAFWNAATVFIVFYLTWLFTKRVGAALLSAFLFAVSFEATQYATWLSNPTIGIWTVPLTYLGLWMWIAGDSIPVKRWGPIVAAVGLGLSIQANIFLAYHIPPFALWLWVARKNVLRQEFIKFLLFFTLSISTMLISEIKFGFKSLSGISQLLISQDPIVLSRGLGEFVVLYLNQLGRVFAFTLYPGNIGYGGVFVLVLIALAFLSWRRGTVSWQPFLIVWILSHILIVSVGGTSTPFLLVGIGPAVSILVGIFIYNWWSQGKRALAVAIFVIIVFGNMSMILKENPKGQTIFAIQKDMILKRQLAAIDYTYQEAGGEPFSINSLTSPLWINIVWTYLYKWYGFPKYGYVPQWHGRDQVGQLDSLEPTKDDTSLYFLILEPMGGIPQKYLPLTVGEEDSMSYFLSEKMFGELIVQKRQKRESI